MPTSSTSLTSLCTSSSRHASVECALGVRDYPTSALIAEKTNFATVRLPDHGWKYVTIGPPDTAEGPYLTLALDR